MATRRPRDQELNLAGRPGCTFCARFADGEASAYRIRAICAFSSGSDVAMMGSVDSPVLGPLEWRQLWKERLNKDDRRRIWKAVRRGAVLSDPDEAAVAAEFAIRRLRGLRLYILFNVLFGIAIVGGMLAVKPSHPVGAYWFLLGLWTLSLFVTPLLGVWHGRRVSRAYRVNRKLSETGGASSATG